MSNRSRLGDLIVMHGPYVAGQRMTALLAGMVDLAEINALRDELIRLRRVEVGAQEYLERWPVWLAEVQYAVDELGVAIGGDA